ncbi:MAG: hypothetical protein ACYCSA_08500 [Thermoplasmataceae archaeon]
MIEQRYLAIKNSNRFTSKFRKGGEKATSYLSQSIKISYVASSVSFIIFSTILSEPYFGPDGSLRGLSNLTFLLYVYLMMISIYSSLIFFNTIKSNNLLEPLNPLPIRSGYGVLWSSWFRYTGSASIFVTIPPLILFYSKYGSITGIVFGILWAFLITIFGFLAGSTISVFIGSHFNERRRSLSNSLKGISRIVFVIAIFLFFETSVYLPKDIPFVIPSLTGMESYFVFFANIPYLIYGHYNYQYQYIYGAVSTAVYGFLIYIFYTRVGPLIYKNLNTTSAQLSHGYEEGQFHFPGYGFQRSLIMKEFRTIFRKSQNLILLFIPVFFILPTLISVLFYGDIRGMGFTSVYYSLVSVVVVCSSFYSLVMIISEGSGIEVLKSLPIRTSRIIFAKDIVGLVVFIFIVVPISVVFLFYSGSPLYLYFIIIFDLLSAYIFSSLFNIRRLYRKIPDGAGTVNFYSFGGNIGLASLFAITIILIMIPVVISMAGTYEIFGSYIGHPVVFYTINGTVNLTGLLMAARLIRGTV